MNSIDLLPNETQVQLDLSDKASIINFLENTELSGVSKAISFIGETIGKKCTEVEYDEIARIYTATSLGLNFVLGKLLNIMPEKSSIIAVTSRSASHVSFDAHYSAIKASTEAFVRSSYQFCKNGQSILCVAPSLVDESSMFRKMSTENIEKHKARTDGPLLTIEELGEYIWQLSPEVCQSNNGRTLQIGRDLG